MFEKICEYCGCKITDTYYVFNGEDFCSMGCLENSLNITEVEYEEEIEKEIEEKTLSLSDDNKPIDGQISMFEVLESNAE